MVVGKLWPLSAGRPSACSLSAAMRRQWCGSKLGSQRRCFSQNGQAPGDGGGGSPVLRLPENFGSSCHAAFALLQAASQADEDARRLELGKRFRPQPTN